MGWATFWVISSQTHLVFLFRIKINPIFLQNIRVNTKTLGTAPGSGETGRFKLTSKETWGRCYDHNFLRFLTIFGEKIGVFLKYQCYDQLFFKI
jgi:hypothetical protein